MRFEYYYSSNISTSFLVPMFQFENMEEVAIDSVCYCKLVVGTFVIRIL